ncbi:MAG: MEKHLA domain-containing protein [Planctomycetaceae bacterium]|nr:MEKHLA domain-containing protein [Planctomycetaceae bacterium]
MSSPQASPWTSPEWVLRTQVLLDSYARWLGRELIDRSGTPVEQSERLYTAPFVVVAHGTEADPILNYANRVALTLWETDLDTLLALPSRKTAEPMHRDERARMLQRTRECGYIDDYQGIRISTTGRRFLIRQAIVWNLVDVAGANAGQAATFSEWEFLPE